MSQLEEFFVFKTKKGLKERLKKLKYKVDEKAYWKRLDYEIGVIEKTGFAGYFLIVADFISWSRRNGILVGPGRGSAAGALTAYALGITNLDPIKNELYFERFLNPERVSPPDVDVDFDKEYRDKVIEYVKERYGADKVAQIGTFGTFKAKAAIKSVARTLGLPLDMANNLCKIYPKPIHGKEVPLKTALEFEPQLRKYYDNSAYDEHKILKWAEKIEGRVASFGIHASGIVIGNDALYKILPLAKGKEDEVVTQWDMGKVEEVGLIKFDFLGLKTLTLIRRTMENVKARHNIDIDIDNLDLEDESVYQKLREGDTCGVFQLEASSGMQNLLVKIRPNNIEDITALIAMYRPGPLASPKMQEYLDWRAGVANPRYDHIDLKPVLHLTGGWLVYQEQLLRIARDLAGYTLAEADILRKAVGKKKEKEMKAQEEQFKKGLLKNGYGELLGDKLWNEFLAFADYGFNKSHAAAYALLVYQTAWLKTHYPTEFMCAALTCDLGNPDQMMIYLEECKRMGIKVLPPDVNSSESLFTVTNNMEIRFGLSAIKFLGEEPVSHIISEREKNGKFTGFLDFANRVDLSKINKKKLEALVLTGAFDAFGDTRAALMKGIDSILEHKAENKSYLSKMETFAKKTKAFEARELEIKEGSKKKSLKIPEAPEVPKPPKIPDVSEFKMMELLTHEKQLTGFYMSGHPLDSYTKLLNSYPERVGMLKEEQPNQIEMVGIIHSIQIKETKKKQKMAFVRVEDKTGTANAVIFPAIWNRVKDILNENSVVLFSAKVDYIEGDGDAIPSLAIKNLDVLPEPVEKSAPRPINLVVPLRQQVIEKVRDILEEYKGNEIRVNLSFVTEDGSIVQHNVPYLISNQDTSFKNAIHKIIYSN